MKILIRAPLRISFFGGGTDLREVYETIDFGCVLSTAINKYIYLEYGDKYNDNYLIDNFVAKENLEIKNLKIWSDITKTGSGLGSSGTLLNGLYLLQNTIDQKPPLTKSELAEKSYEFERFKMEASNGKQDSYASAIGGFNLIRFNKDNSVEIDNLNQYREQINELESRLLLYDLNMPRNANSVLKKQKENTLNKLDVLIKMRDMVNEGLKCLINKQYDKFGRLLNESWLLKKQLADNVSNDKIDQIYNEAIKCGAIGGKVNGSGNGGFITIYCPDELIKNRIIYQFNKKYPELKLTPFKFIENGTEVVEYIK